MEEVVGVERVPDALVQIHDVVDVQPDERFRVVERARRRALRRDWRVAQERVADGVVGHRPGAQVGRDPIYNASLCRDGFELIEKTRIAGKPVFVGRYVGVIGAQASLRLGRPCVARTRAMLRGK